MLTKRLSCLTLFSIAILASFGAARAQAQELTLHLSRVFGYSSLSANEIQGTFTLQASGPAEMERVQFTIDGQIIGESTQPPFRIRFDTSSFVLGPHTISAVATTHGGGQLKTAPVMTNFVTAEAGMRAGLKIAGPLIGLILIAMLLSIAVPTLLVRGKKLHLPPGTERNYGMRGGAICGNCRRPFPLRLMSLNMGPFHKFDRCPFCGKWALVRVRSLQELRTAERAELDHAQSSEAEILASEEERLRKELDQSRYRDI